MSFSSALAPEFSTATRARGVGYVATGRVSIESRSPDAFDASVRGTEPYRVRLTAVPDGRTTAVLGSCTCPFATDHATPCKHLWATVLVAERDGWPELGRAPGRTGLTFRLVDPPGAAGGEDETVDAEWLLRAGRHRTVAARSYRPAAAAPEGTAFLNHLDNQLLARDTPTAVLTFASGELIYVIDAAASRLHTGVVLQLMWRQRKRTGDWGRPRPAKPDTLSVPDAPADARSVLAALVGASAASAPTSWFDDQRPSAQASTFLLTEGLTTDLLPIIGRSGRAWLRLADHDRDLRPLQWDDGPAWVFVPEVRAEATGFRVSGAFTRGEDRIALETPVLAVSAGFLITQDHLARLEPLENPALLMALRAKGPVAVAHPDSARLANALARAGVPSAAVPEALRMNEVDTAPTPHLVLNATRWGSPNQFDATVSFDYDGSIVPNDRASVTLDANRRRSIRRRPAVERAFFNRLLAIGFKPSYDYGGEPVVRVPAKAMLPAVHTLLSEGWQVAGHGHAYRRATAVRLSVSSGLDWFDLEATVEFDGARLPVADLLGALRRRESTVRLGDGSVGILPEEWLARYTPLIAAAEVEDGRLRFRRTQAALLDALLEARAADTSVSVDDAFVRVRRELETFSHIEAVDPPPGFHGTLRDYQREGLGWFLFLRRFGFGGCLADDMGLGKTIMVLALLAWWRRERDGGDAGPRPSLIVVPRSLVHNWISEANRFTPGLTVLDYSGAGRTSNRGRLDEFDLVITTYGTLRRDVVDLQETEFQYVILDEAQAIKNAATVSSKAARVLRGRHRLALSGTPIENHLGELWSLVEFLNPGLLGRASAFEQVIGAPGADGDTLSLVTRGLRPFILRRTKAQVARELPERTEQTLFCDLSAPEREFYDGLRRHYRDALLARVDEVGMAQSKIQVLEGLLRLRQAACHSGLVDKTRQHASSAKFEVLLPRLREIVEEGHKAIVFSQFTSLLALLRIELDREPALAYEYLDGRTRDRQAHVTRFQSDPGCPLFLVSLKAGGVGLNLTAAEYVFLLDPWWNPAVEAQAIDRTHRIGQTREVFAYRVIATGTVEEKVLALQQSKRSLADAVLRADAGGLRNLQREDLELLLS